MDSYVPRTPEQPGGQSSQPCKCCCCCKEHQSSGDPTHWEKVNAWADSIIKVKDFLIALGTILAVIIMIRTAVYLSSTASDSAEAISKGIAMMGNLGLGPVSNVTKASDEMKKEMDPDLKAIDGAGKSGFRSAPHFYRHLV